MRTVSTEVGTEQGTTTAVETLPARTLTPRERLEALETEAVGRGIPERDLTEIRQIGECNDQVNARIVRMTEWLSAHPA